MNGTAMTDTVAPVRLADLIRQESAPKVKRCKTCNVLDLLTDDDRADFIYSSQHGTKPPVLARAISIKMRLLDLDGSLGEDSVRGHLGHAA